MGDHRYIGVPLPRREDRRILLGRANYVADLRLPDALECVFVRSPYPHALIKGVSDSSNAKLFLWEDMEGEVGCLPAISRPKGSLFPKLVPLANGKTRFAGEPVGVAVSTSHMASRYTLQDEVEKIDVEYEPLQPVLDVETASHNGAPLVYEELGTNTLYRSTVGGGDVDGALASSERVFYRRIVFPANYGFPLEPRGVVASYDESEGTLTVWSSTQWPHFVRTLLSEVLGLAESKIRVVAPDVGGGFGNKQDLYREEIVVAWLSTKLRKPVRWVATRSEDMHSTVQSGLQVHYAEIGVDNDGRITALRDRVYADLGSVGPMSFGPPVITQLGLSGPYDIGAVQVELNCVATNKPPTGAYRGYGQQQAAFVLERLVEEASRALGLHPLEFRRRNVVKSFPYTTKTGRVLERVDYVGMIDLCTKLFGGIRTRGLGSRLGCGFAFGFESGGIGPACIQDSVGARHKGYDSVRLRVEADGSVSVFTGLSPHGQGLETTLSQVCAELLGVDLERVRVYHGDTQSSPYGYGTWGSRSAVVGAGALLKCVEELKRRVVMIASKALNIDAHRLEYVDGWVTFRDNGVKLMSLAEAAKLGYQSPQTEDGTGAGLEVTVVYEPRGLTISGGLHAVMVEVDEETGVVRLLRYILVHDSGRMINPLIVEGQIVGGLVQGVGEALLEEYGYTDQGVSVSSNLLEYAVPTAMESPSFELHHLDAPSNLNTLGLKGVGESGIVGPAAAIANAVSDALGGVFSNLEFVPLKPEVVWLASLAVTHKTH
ncbi:MAG: xanthine dehydrogenase family protein molybdopterin-binding subunit [Thermoprotei archaeon]